MCVALEPSGNILSTRRDVVRELLLGSRLFLFLEPFGRLRGLSIRKPFFLTIIFNDAMRSPCPEPINADSTLKWRAHRWSMLALASMVLAVSAVTALGKEKAVDLELTLGVDVSANASPRPTLMLGGIH